MTMTTTDTQRPAAARRLEEVVQNKFADRVPINQAAVAVDDGLVFVEELFVCRSVISIPTMNLFTIPWHVSCLLNTLMNCKSDPLVIVWLPLRSLSKLQVQLTQIIAIYVSFEQ